MPVQKELKNAYIGSTPAKRIMMRPNGVEKQVRPSGHDKDYLCFTAEQANSTVKLKKIGSPTAVTLETSTNGKNWSSYTIGDAITLSNIGDKVYFRNTSTTTTGFSIGVNDSYRFQLSGGDISASGDVTTLLNKNGTNILSNFCFIYLFGSASKLITPPRIPATTLGESCFRRMFSGCSGLTALPKLEALSYPAISCYEMFYGCTKIKLSTSQTGEYQTAYRIPTTGTGSVASTNSLYNMFYSTGGSFTGTPTINTTYYTSNTVV